MQVSSKSSTAQTILHKYLSNGCECYLEQTDFAPLVSLQMWVKTGSIDEEEHEFGMAHVLEHMLFKGTERFPKTGDVARLVEAAGGEINAYTTFDHTVYYISAPREFAFQAAELLFDVVGASLLDAEELCRELEVVIEEIRRGRDNPSSRLSHSLFAHTYDGHPMARPVIGYEEVVSTFNRENLMAFYKRWYIPNNMFFVAAGDFDLTEMDSCLESLSKRFTSGSLPQRRWSKTHKLAVQTSPQCDVIHGPYQETRLQLTVPAPSLEDDESPAWDMFASILGQGDSSRLAHAVKDEAQLVTAIDSYLYSPRFPYGFAGFGFYARSETAKEAIFAAVGEISRLANEGPTPAELQRVLTTAKAEKIYARESVEGLVRSVGNNLMTTARLDFGTQYLQKLQSVTTEQVRRCAQNVCDSIAKGRVVAVAASNQDHSDIINKNALCEALATCAEMLKGESPEQSSGNTKLAAFRSKTLASQRNPSISQTQIDLDSHCKLHFNTRTSKRLPVTSHVLVWRWGQHEEPEGKTGLNAFVAQMLTRGTTRQSYRTFVSELEEMGASVSAFSGRDLFGLRLDALSEVQPRALKLMMDCLVRPALSGEEFERVMRETSEVLVAQKDSPGSRMGRISGPLLFGNHAYGRPSLGTPETLHNINLDDVVMQWQRLLLSNTFVFSGAGDFNTTQSLDIIASELAKIAGQRSQREAEVERLKSPVPAPQLPPQPRVGFDVFEREQAHISLAVRGYTLSDSRRTALEVASSVLGGMGGRLFMDLRDTQSLAYSVGCSQSPGLWGGSFSSYIGTAAGKSKQALAGLKHHLEKIATQPPSEEELSRAKNALIGSQSLDSQHHHYQASQLAMSDVYGLGFDNFLGFKERVENVTAENVSSAVYDLLKTEGACVTVVGPKSTWVPEANDPLLSGWEI
jgi:zinc protease